MRIRVCLAAGLAALCLASAAGAIIPEQVPDLPVLGPETPRGHIATTAVSPVTSSPKIVDGDPSDWIGASTRLGGTAIYSAGEYVYQDYLNDDHGVDDGRDVERLATLDPLRETEPRTYRLDVVAQVVGDEFGVDGPPLISAKPQYGDAALPGPLEHEADIVQARIAADAGSLYFLVRTAAMTVTPGTAVLILLDTDPGGSYPAPGDITTGAEWAFLFAGDRLLESRRNGLPAPLPVGGDCDAAFRVATNPTDYVNATEISLCRDALGALPQTVNVGIATGVVNEAGSGLANVSTGTGAADLVNVAFRFDEPVRIRMDRDQAIALHGGSMDGFLAPVDLSKLTGGATESFEPGPGYYDRIYESSSSVNRETYSSDEHQGAFQHYGLYIPTTYRAGTSSPATVWLHPRSSGTAHLAGAWVPGIIRQLGERRRDITELAEQPGHIIISPSARGSSTWYQGRGHEDFLESWDDAMASFSIDPDRVYVAGHSMGGFGSYLVGLLYPDRFAAAFPISGPPVQGLWLGVGKPREPQNGATVEDLEAQLFFDLVENARNVPYIIFQGSNDELVLTPGPARVAARFTELGYRNRFYVFPGQDHYVPLIVDEYEAAARYFDRFRRDPNPSHVTYRVRPALERVVERLSTPSGTTLDYTFDGAYWVDGLTVRDGDPNVAATMGTFDAVSHALRVPTKLDVPEAGVVEPGQTSPFVMTGLQWIEIGGEARRNAATISLTNIATATLDAARMGLSTGAPIALAVASDGAATLRVLGTWPSEPTVTGATSSSYSAGVLTIVVAAGEYVVTIAP